MKYLSDVVTLALEQEKCTACAMCTRVCPHGVFLIRDKKAHIIHRDQCMECGACARNCPEQAISVKSGVGCAAGVINGLLRGTEPSCDCSGPNQSSCC